MRCVFTVCSSVFNVNNVTVLLLPCSLQVTVLVPSILVLALRVTVLVSVLSVGTWCLGLNFKGYCLDLGLALTVLVPSLVYVPKRGWAYQRESWSGGVDT